LARRQALDLPEAGPLLLQVLVGGQKVTGSLRREDRSDAVSVYLLDQATGKAPQIGLVRYILGRLLFQRGGYAESIPELRRSLELGLPDRRFVYQAELMIGQAELLLGQSGAAQATFDGTSQAGFCPTKKTSGPRSPTSSSERATGTDFRRLVDIVRAAG
jgi:hypothetical protein